MMSISPKTSNFLKIGVILFCFMCLFFATSMASKYEVQKTKSEALSLKIKELEEEIQELSVKNQKLLQIRSALVQEKESMAKEIAALQEKYAHPENLEKTFKQTAAKNISGIHDQSTNDIDKRLSEARKGFQLFPALKYPENKLILEGKEPPTAEQTR